MPDLREAARKFVGFGHPREALKLMGTASLTITNAALARRFLTAWPQFQSVKHAVTFRAVATARADAVEAAFAARKSERTKR